MYSAVEPLPPRTQRRETTARRGEPQPEQLALGGDAASGHSTGAGGHDGTMAGSDSDGHVSQQPSGEAGVEQGYGGVQVGA